MADGENAYLSLDERAYLEVRKMIVQGDLKPGHKIVQENLADRLGISRTPLRRAIATLAQQNFLEMDNRGVAYVRKFDNEELTSIWEIRAVLEGLVCRLLAHRIRPQHIAYLRSLITSAAEEITDQDWTAYRQADAHFHNYLSELVDDPLVSNMLDSFQILSLTLARGLLRSPEETLPEHLEIIDALSSGDADRAEQAMLDHIRITIQHVRASKIEMNGVTSRALREISGDLVASLANDLKETVLVAHIEGQDAVIASYREGPRALRIALSSEGHLPLHATAAGKALLAWEEEDDLSRYFEAEKLEAITPNTITHLDVLRDELQEVRRKGFAVEDEEYELGGRSIAFPIRRHGRVIAAAAVLAPAFRLNVETNNDVVPRLSKCANAVSARL